MSIECPKCERTLEPSAEVEGEAVGTTPQAIYQCDECFRTVDFMGETMDLPITFMLDERGRPYDPADPEADLSKD